MNDDANIRDPDHDDPVLGPEDAPQPEPDPNGPPIIETVNSNGSTVSDIEQRETDEVPVRLPEAVEPVTKKAGIDRQDSEQSPMPKLQEE